MLNNASDPKILYWESQSAWDGTRFEYEFGMTWIKVPIAANVVAAILNGLYVGITLRHTKLRSELLANPSNQLFFAFSVHNTVAAICHSAFRAAFFHQQIWSNNLCFSMAFVNHFFVATGVSFMIAIASEMYLSILNLKRVTFSQTVKMVAVIVVGSGIWTCVQLAPPFKVTYAKSGLYCFGTSWVSWPAIVNMIFFPVAAVFFAFVYIRIYIRLGFLLRQKSSRLQGVQTTMVPQEPSSSSNNDVAGHGTTGGAPSCSFQVRGKQSQPEANFQSLREKRIQRRFVLRGTLALFNSCCYYVPLWIACYQSYQTGRRNGLALDAAIIVLGCLSGICDPIIGAAQDTRFLRALREVWGSRDTALAQDAQVTATAEWD